MQDKSIVILTDLTNDQVKTLFSRYAKDVGIFPDYIEDCLAEMGDSRKAIVTTFEEELGNYMKIVD